MEGLFSFIIITLLIIIVPGPDFLIVMKIQLILVK